MNITQIVGLTALTIIGYFLLKPHFEPRLEEIRDRVDSWQEQKQENLLNKLEKDLKQMMEQEKIVDAKQATQTQQDRVDEKKRALNTHDKSLIFKIREEWTKN